MIQGPYCLADDASVLPELVTRLPASAEFVAGDEDADKQRQNRRRAYPETPFHPPPWPRAHAPILPSTAGGARGIWRARRCCSPLAGSARLGDRPDLGRTCGRIGEASRCNG